MVRFIDGKIAAGSDAVDEHRARHRPQPTHGLCQTACFEAFSGVAGGWAEETLLRKFFRGRRVVIANVLHLTPRRFREMPGSRLPVAGMVDRAMPPVHSKRVAP